MEPNSHNRLRLAAVGLGARSSIYLGHAADMPDKYEVVAGADPDPDKCRYVAGLSKNPKFRTFPDDRAILAEPKLADVMIIGTQDRQHREHAITAMEKGYDLLLEKPIATNMEDVLAVESAALRLSRKVMVCHVLRFSPMYAKVKTILDSGRIGRILSINALEGVGAFHHAHSYVRGKWSVTAKSSPMIVAKSCHDLDLLHWLTGEDYRAVSSFGSRDYFRVENAPEGAPARCHEGCPVNGSCAYDAEHYATGQAKFIREVNPLLDTPEAIRSWVRPSPWGRCVYRCDNDTVDHQVVNLLFESNITATFTMTAFARGRGIEVFGSKGTIRAGAFCKANTGDDIVVTALDANEGEDISLETYTGGYEGHGDADLGLMQELYDEMHQPGPEQMRTSIQNSVLSHVMGFAAEESRKTGQTVRLDEFRKRFDSATVQC